MGYNADEIYAMMIQHDRVWFHTEVLNVLTTPDITTQFSDQDQYDFLTIALGFMETRYLKGITPYNGSPHS